MFNVRPQFNQDCDTFRRGCLVHGPIDVDSCLVSAIRAETRLMDYTLTWCVFVSVANLSHQHAVVCIDSGILKAKRILVEAAEKTLLVLSLLGCRYPQFTAQTQGMKLRTSCCIETRIKIRTLIHSPVRTTSFTM
eukprot:1044710-Amphidinium_carterae.1